MPKYIIWYKKEVEAQDLNKLLRIEKKVPIAFHSIIEKEEINKGELPSLIGFQLENEYEEL